jgi:hypothetical protein
MAVDGNLPKCGKAGADILINPDIDPDDYDYGNMGCQTYEGYKIKYIDLQKINILKGNCILYSLKPVMEFQVQGYKIRKIFA